MLPLSLSKAAARFLDTLPPKQYRQITRKIIMLMADPQPTDTERLKGHDYSRVTVGEYRVIFAVHDGVLCAVCSAPLVRVANGPVSLFFLCRKTRRVLQMLDFPRGARSLPKCVVFECGEMWVLSETKRAVLYYGPRADRALCVG